MIAMRMTVMSAYQGNNLTLVDVATTQHWTRLNLDRKAKSLRIK